MREPGKALLSVHRMHRVEALGLWTGETIPLAKGHSCPGGFGFEGWFSLLFTFKWGKGREEGI